MGDGFSEELDIQLDENDSIGDCDPGSGHPYPREKIPI
jgi:hypothetical protein